MHGTASHWVPLWTQGFSSLVARKSKDGVLTVVGSDFFDNDLLRGNGNALVINGCRCSGGQTGAGRAQAVTVRQTKYHQQATKPGRNRLLSNRGAGQPKTNRPQVRETEWEARSPPPREPGRYLDRDRDSPCRFWRSSCTHTRT